MKLKALSTSAFLLAATTSLAQTDLAGVVEILKQQGFTSVEIENEGGRVIVEAKGGGLERKIIYSSDGTILSDTVEHTGGDDDDRDDEDDEDGDESDEDDEGEDDDEEDDADESDDDDGEGDD